MKRIPILPTLLVLLAVGVMVRLGFWQLDRLAQKEAMLADYAYANQSAVLIDYAHWMSPDNPTSYHQVRIVCSDVGPDSPVAGRSSTGASGWAHQFSCQFPIWNRGNARADVVIGWSDSPAAVRWGGGEVIGREVPSKGALHRVIADPPLAGLQPNAKPDPRDIPNNHLAYAVQWFLFAGVALVIYALALRKRMRERT
jgi:surfeit locus 1 family protein